jgi:transcriptional regulator GlxA family with amidase domain
MSSQTRHVVIVTFPGMQSLDAVGPVEVFAGATQVVASRRPSADAAYRVHLVSTTGTMLRTESGISIGTDPLPTLASAELPSCDTLLIAGGAGVHDARRDTELVDWVRFVAPRARRVGTVCTGTFLAAEAGLLDGSPVTTHWARAEQLADEFPHLDVNPDPIYTRSDTLWTSAGVTAGIDMSLAMVEDDVGTEVAQTVARWLVMFLRRPGGQTQFAAPLWMPRAERSTVRGVQSSIEEDPAADHRIAALAARAAMSPRHFSRVFVDEVGETPGHYVERVRVEAARRRLEDTTDTVGVIARACGFGTSETMRRSFLRRLGVAPDHYRRRFGSAA